ncbi:hypothetical protein BK643_00710 [Pseudomonas protegens]|uniref:hypothetical protein n=1 Tax=Pseudomonas protegens TaxID=380021 RepID=UPI000F49B2A6|nr:hypothetical protein [Pseudomonas protegens]ROM19243.1 hypothetical protein BK643_00710 [Pseudomonas protegens]
MVRFSALGLVAMNAWGFGSLEGPSALVAASPKARQRLQGLQELQELQELQDLQDLQGAEGFV